MNYPINAAYQYGASFGQPLYCPNITPIPGSFRKHPLVEGWTLPERQIDNLNLPKMQPLINQLTVHFGLPKDMVLMTAMAGANYPVAATTDIESPGGWTLPASLYLLLNIQSGAGKTPLQRLLFSGIEEIEDDLLALKFGDAFDPDDPKRPMLFLDDNTALSMMECVNQVETAYMVSTEASDSFDKWDKLAIKVIDQLFDSDTVRMGRSGPNRYNRKLFNKRLGIFWAQQLEVLLEQIKTKKGKYWQDVGAMNRFLICLADIDFSKVPSFDNDMLKSVLAPYKARQQELMREAFSPGYQRKIVRCDPAAAKLYEQIRFEFRLGSAKGSYFEAVTGHAAKLADIVLRVAATFHVFEGFEGDISEGTLRQAYEVVLNFADYRVALSTPIPQYMLDAKEISETVNRLFRFRRGPFVTPEDRYVSFQALKDELPNSIKNSNSFRHALRLLRSNNEIVVWWAQVENKKQRAKWVDLHPGWGYGPPRWLTLLEPAI